MFENGKTRRQATSAAERSRAHRIIGVPPVFSICAKGDDQKLDSQLCAERVAGCGRCRATNAAAQALTPMLLSARRSRETSFIHSKRRSHYHGLTLLERFLDSSGVSKSRVNHSHIAPVGRFEHLSFDV